MSLFLTHHLELTPEKYIFGHIPSPFLNSYPISLLLCPCTCSSLVGSQRGHERLRPALPTAAGASPGPGSPPAPCVPSHTALPVPQAFTVTVLSTAWPGSDACIPPRPGTQRSSSLFVSFCLWYSIQLSGHAQMLCSWPS